MDNDLEEGRLLRLDFTKLDSVVGTGVLPCAVQDVGSNEVIL